MLLARWRSSHGALLVPWACWRVALSLSAVGLVILLHPHISVSVSLLHMLFTVALPLGFIGAGGVNAVEGRCI